MVYPKVFILEKKFFQIGSQRARIYWGNITTYTGALGVCSFTSTIQSMFVVSLNLINFDHILKRWHLDVFKVNR